MAKTITVQGLTFERDEAVGRFCDDGLYYEHTDANTGIKWTIFRPPCPDYCTPYWTCYVERVTYRRGTLLRTMTSCTELGDSKVMVDPLCHDVPHGTEDPPMQLLGAVADMIRQRVDPFGPGTTPWTDPQIACSFELDQVVRWKGIVYEITDREWRGRWLLTLKHSGYGGIVRGLPAHLVEPVTECAGQQLKLI